MQWEQELFEQLISYLPQNPVMDGEEDTII